MRAVTLLLSSLFLLPMTKASDEKSERRIQGIDKKMLLLNSFTKNAREETVDQIKAIDVLLAKGTKQTPKVTLLINKATQLLTLARIDLVASQKMELSLSTKESLDAAEDILNSLLQDNASSQLAAKINFLKGVGNLYRDISYNELFEKSIELDPQSEAAPWMSLMLAENLFDASKFTEAQKAYKIYYRKYTFKQKDLAVYKLAWCAINLKQYFLAEKLLLVLVKLRNKSGFSADAIRDLAFLASIHRTDDEVVVLSQKSFLSGTKERDAFLSYVLSYRETRQELRPQSPLIPALMAEKKDPDARFSIVLSVLRASKTGFASHEYLNAYSLVKSYYSNKLSALSMDSYETETSNIMKSFYETYNGKVKSPEQWSGDTLSKSLKEITVRYLATFLRSENRAQVFNMQTEICMADKDYHCLIETYKSIVRDPTQAKRHEVATEELVKVWDELYKIDPKKNTKSALKAALYFVSQYPNSQKWLLTQRRISEYYTDLNNYSAAIKHLNVAFERSNEEELLFRIQRLRFLSKNYTEIIEDKRLSISKSSRLLLIFRDAALQQSALFKNANDLKGYGRVVAIYLSTQPPQNDAHIAQLDYLNTLYVHEEYRMLSDEWFKVSLEELSRDEYREIAYGLWLYYFKKAEIEECEKVLLTQSNRFFDDLKILNTLFVGGNVTLGELDKLGSEKRAYIQILLLLTTPEVLVSGFEARPPRNRQEISLATWAYRINFQTYEIVKNRKSLRIFGKDFNFSVKNYAFELLKRKVSRISIPTEASTGDLYLQSFSKSLTELRATRKSFLNLVKQLSRSEQAIIALQLSEMETQMGNLLLKSPVPRELASESDISNYENGLKKASLEFFDQAQEFNKVAASAKEYLDNMEYAWALSEPLKAQNTSWPSLEYLNSVSYAPLKYLQSHQGVMASLTLLDLMKNERKESAEIYYRLKLEILKPLWVKIPMLRLYLANELSEAGQSQIINEWRQYVRGA